MARLVELRLPAFKSMVDAVLPIDDVTLLVGRNGSGKSNALDGLWALCRLANGDDIKDSIDGGIDGPSVRGGIAGCPPAGRQQFSLGCVVEDDADRITYDVTIATDPMVQVVHERLHVAPADPRSRVEPRDLLTTDDADPHSSDIVARWNNRKRGKNPPLPMRASRLAVTQVSTRVPETTQAGRRIHRVAETLLRTLDGVLVLDPVPSAMRGFVPARDLVLRRSAENLSAAVASLMADDRTAATILSLMQQLSESTVDRLSMASSSLGDVMLELDERIGGRSYAVPARQMSDGTLRFLAVVAAVLQGPTEEGDDPPDRTLVIEELENGLHPSQAARVLGHLTREAKERGVRLLATTHSTAMLDGLAGEDHRNVIVCDRDEDGWSRLTPLPDLPSYVDVVTSGGPGEAALRDELHPEQGAARDASAALDDILRAG